MADYFLLSAAQNQRREALAEEELFIVSKL